MSADDVTNHVTRLLDFSFGCHAATTSPSAPPIGGALSQGTLSPASRGVVLVGPVQSDLSPGFVSITRSVCMFLSSQEYLNSACLGCVGAKGEKFCTKRKVRAGELDMSGVKAHAKKMLLEPDHLYYWDSLKEHGFSMPMLKMTYLTLVPRVKQ